MAPRVGDGDDRGAGRPDVRHLGLENPVCGFGLHQVVDSGAAAAIARALELHQLDPGYRAQQVSGLFHDALGVAQVARVGAGYPLRYRPRRLDRTLFDKELAGVADFPGESHSSVIGSGAQQAVVVLERSAASPGVVDDRVVTVGVDGGDVERRQVPGEVAIAGVESRSAAAGLTLGDINLESVVSEHAERGFIDPAQNRVLDTAFEKGHPAAGLAASRARLSGVSRRGDRRRQKIQRSPKGPRHQRNSADQANQPEPLRQSKGARQPPHPAPAGQKLAKTEPPG